MDKGSSKQSTAAPRQCLLLDYFENCFADISSCLTRNKRRELGQTPYIPWKSLNYWKGLLTLVSRMKPKIWDGNQSEEAHISPYFNSHNQSIACSLGCSLQYRGIQKRRAAARAGAGGQVRKAIRHTSHTNTIQLSHNSFRTDKHVASSNTCLLRTNRTKPTDPYRLWTST